MRSVQRNQGMFGSTRESASVATFLMGHTRSNGTIMPPAAPRYSRRYSVSDLPGDPRHGGYGHECWEGCEAMTKPVSERASVSELRKAALDAPDAFGCRRRAIDALADRLEEAERDSQTLASDYQEASAALNKMEERAEKAEREVRRFSNRILNWIDGRTLGYPHGDLKELREFILALRRGDCKCP